jgi:hypothetical protein
MKNAGFLCVLTGLVTVWRIYEMATATEGPSQTLALMNYIMIFFMGGLTIFLGFKWLAGPKGSSQ